MLSMHLITDRNSTPCKRVAKPKKFPYPIQQTPSRPQTANLSQRLLSNLLGDQHLHRSRASSPGRPRSAPACPRIVRDARIVECQRVLKSLVSEIGAFKCVSKSVAWNTERLLEQVLAKSGQLQKIRRSAEDDPHDLEEVAYVENLRHKIRMWKYALQDRRQVKKIQWLNKENKELHRAHTELLKKKDKLLKSRQNMHIKIRDQAREKLKWKSAECNTHKQMNTLEASFGHVAGGLRSISPCDPSSANAMEPSQVLQSVRAMKVVAAQASRANREIETMIGFDKGLRKKLIGKIEKLLETPATHRQLRSDEECSGQLYDYHSAWCGLKPDDLLGYTPSSKAKMLPDAEFGIQFLQHLWASNGTFPQMFLADLPHGKKSNVLRFLVSEFMFNVKRVAALERVFQLLQELRMHHNIDEAVARVVDVICCTLQCKRASYWVVDNDRGIAWTKFAAGKQELCIPLTSGFVGSAVATKCVLSVVDAYDDRRFNNTSDIASGFRTKSVLCVPIIMPTNSGESKKTVIAVVQSVNKDSKNGNDRYFDDSDIFMLAILGFGMTNVALKCEEEELNLRAIMRKNTLLSCTWELGLKCRDPEDLLRIIKKYLAEMFQSLDATLTIAYKDCITRLDVTSKYELIQVTQPRGVGIVGASVELRDRIHVRNVALDPRYDPAIDIEIEKDALSEYSLHCIPLKRGTLLSAVVQWVCKKRLRVDFGDDGLFSENNRRHLSLVGKMMSNVLMQLETWYPLMDRWQDHPGDGPQRKASISRGHFVGRS